MSLRLPPQFGPAQLSFLYLAVAVLQVAGAMGAVRITSWFRSQEDNARVGGLPSSLHLAGLAWDLIGPDELLGRIRGLWQAFGLDAVWEGDHLHIEFDGPSLRSRT